jgi:hypothetical protein
MDCSIDARSGETLVLDLDTGGSVTIRGWDEPRVELRSRLKSDDLPANHAELARDEGGVRLRAWYTGSSHSLSSSHRFELSVPRRFDVRLESAGGDLTIQGVEGAFAGSTGGGDLLLQDLGGSANLSTGGGTIRVLDSRLEGSVSTGGGPVTLSHVSGGLRGSSGSGPVVYAEPEQPGRRHRRHRGGRPAVPGLGKLHVERAGGGHPPGRGAGRRRRQHRGAATSWWGARAEAWRPARGVDASASAPWQARCAQAPAPAMSRSR